MKSTTESAAEEAFRSNQGDGRQAMYVPWFAVPAYFFS
jgi:hypothetical protein